MNVETRDFGEIEIQEEDVIHFAQPLYGFESLHEYVCLYEQSVSDHFIWLQSVEERDICFILMDPELVLPGYRPRVPAGIQKLLGEGDFMCWLIVVVAEDFEKSTVNLKSPIVLNPATGQAAQVILEEDFPIRHPLIPQEKRDGAC